MKSRSILIKKAEKQKKEIELISTKLVEFQEENHCKLIAHLPQIIDILKGKNTYIRYWRRGAGQRYELISKEQVIINFFSFFNIINGLEVSQVGMSKELTAKFNYMRLKWKRSIFAHKLLSILQFCYEY